MTPFGAYKDGPDALRASVVVAVLNEAPNIAPLVREITTALADIGPYEIIYVDDGSTDETAQRVLALCKTVPQLRLIQHEARAGQSAALRSGVLAARSPWIATLDGDGQNDPADLAPMLNLAWKTKGRAPLIAGYRQRRNDPPSKLFATKIANGVRRAILKDDCPDTGCGTKVYRRDDFLMLPFFGALHRFIPALMQSYGVPLKVYPVHHRARTEGVSKYTNWRRGLIGVYDLMGVVWLKQRMATAIAHDVTPKRKPRP